MALHLVFADVSNAADPRAYIERKLADFFPGVGAGELARLVPSAWMPGAGDAMPLAAPDELPRVSDGQRRLLDIKIAQLDREVERRSPLIDGEELVEPDRHTLLLRDCGDLVAGTPVVVRRTSLATLYYPYQLARVTASGNLQMLADPGLPGVGGAELAPQLGLGGFSFAELLVTLAKGVAGGMGSKFGDAIGSAILNAIFPGGEGIDTEKMLDEIAKIVEMKNTRQTIGEQAAVVNAVIKENTFFYTVRKHAGAPKSELYGLLTGYQQRLRGAIESLAYRDSSVDVAKPGLAPYVLGASALLAVYQEMALQDPLTDDPKSSSILKSITLTAKDCVGQVESTANRTVSDAVDARLSQITEVTTKAICNSVSCQQFWIYYDHEAGTEYHVQDTDCKHTAEEQCRAHRAAYADSVRKKTKDAIEATVNPMRGAAGAWKKLIETPLPDPKTPVEV